MPQSKVGFGYLDDSDGQSSHAIVEVQRICSGLSGGKYSGFKVEMRASLRTVDTETDLSVEVADAAELIDSVHFHSGALAGDDFCAPAFGFQCLELGHFADKDSALSREPVFSRGCQGVEAVT